jgi:hypothetical protein
MTKCFGSGSTHDGERGSVWTCPVCGQDVMIAIPRHGYAASIPEHEGEPTEAVRNAERYREGLMRRNEWAYAPAITRLDAESDMISELQFALGNDFMTAAERRRLRNRAREVVRRFEGDPVADDPHAMDALIGESVSFREARLRREQTDLPKLSFRDVKRRAADSGQAGSNAWVDGPDRDHDRDAGRAVVAASDCDSVLGLAAIVLAHDFWRGQWGTVEDAHIHRPPHRIRRISDGEMFAANIKVTRIILEELRSGFDLHRIVERLTDPSELRVRHWDGTKAGRGRSPRTLEGVDDPGRKHGTRQSAYAGRGPARRGNKRHISGAPRSIGP